MKRTRPCPLRPGDVHSAEGWRWCSRPSSPATATRIRPLLSRRRRLRQARAVRAARSRGHRLRHPAPGRFGPARADRPPADPARRPPAEEAAGVLRQLQLPGPELEQAAPGGGQGRVAPGRLYPRVGFIVTNLKRPAERISKFYNGRGTAEQWIKEGKQALRWTRLSCRAFRDNAVRLQLFALAYNLANFLRAWRCPNEVAHWSLTTLREKLVKIGARIVRHGRYVVFQLAEVAVPRAAVRRDPAPDRPPARTARCGGLTGRTMRAAGAEGRAMRRDRPAGTKTARTGLRTGVQRLSLTRDCRRTHPPVDRGPAEEQAFGCRPSPSGECRLHRRHRHRGRDARRQLRARAGRLKLISSTRW